MSLLLELATARERKEGDGSRVVDRVEGDAPVRAGYIGFVVLGSSLIVLCAVALEVAAGAAANSSWPSWATWVVPLTWPQPVRVVWWLVVAAAALSFRLNLRHLGFRQPPWLIAASVGPFVAFAGGVAFGADWATWH